MSCVPFTWLPRAVQLLLAQLPCSFTAATNEYIHFAPANTDSEGFTAFTIISFPSFRPHRETEANENEKCEKIECNVIAFCQNIFIYYSHFTNEISTTGSSS